MHIREDTVYRGYKLGLWLLNLRRKYQAGTLPDTIRQRLHALGVDLDISPRLSRFFDVADRYYREHGNLDVPSGYRDPVTNYQLSTALLRVSKRHAGIIGPPLTDAELQWLASRGMNWERERSRTTSPRNQHVPGEWADWFQSLLEDDDLTTLNGILLAFNQRGWTRAALARALRRNRRFVDRCVDAALDPIYVEGEDIPDPSSL